MPATPASAPEHGPGTGDAEPGRDEIAALADVLRKDGAALSATETLRAELSNADHLGILGPIWYDLTRRAQATRFTAALRYALPEPLADDALADPACTWLMPRSQSGARRAGAATHAFTIVSIRCVNSAAVARGPVPQLGSLRLTPVRVEAGARRPARHGGGLTRSSGRSPGQAGRS